MTDEQGWKIEGRQFYSHLLCLIWIRRGHFLDAQTAICYRVEELK
jgi:hypothetical protein